MRRHWGCRPGSWGCRPGRWGCRPGRWGCRPDCWGCPPGRWGCRPGSWGCRPGRWGCIPGCRGCIPGRWGCRPGRGRRFGWLSPTRYLLLFPPHCVPTVRVGRGIRSRPIIYVLQIAIKCRIKRISKIRNSPHKRYAGKAGATGKSPLPNAGHAGAYDYAGKTSAIAKSLNPDAGHAVAYGYAGKAGAIFKSTRACSHYGKGYKCRPAK